MVATPLTLADVQPALLYRLSDAAGLLNVTPDHLRREWIPAKKIAARRVGGRWQVPGAELLRVLGPAPARRRSETPAQRDRRVEALRAECRRLVKAKAGVS